MRRRSVGAFLRLWDATRGRTNDPTAMFEVFMGGVCLLWAWVFLTGEEPNHPLFLAMSHSAIPICGWAWIFVFVGIGSMLAVAWDHLGVRGWMAAGRFILWTFLAYFMATTGQTTWRSYLWGTLFCFLIDVSLQWRMGRRWEGSER